MTLTNSSEFYFDFNDCSIKEVNKHVWISGVKKENLMNKFIVIDSGTYGRKFAIPFSEQTLNAILSAKTVSQEYNTETSTYHLYAEKRKVEVSIIVEADIETAPIKKEEEIKKLEAEREKLLKLADEMSDRINEKLNK